MAAVLNTICRGIVGYISYLATCDSSSVYSEYLLYEPIVRIAKSQGYKIRCEFPVPALKKDRGATPRIDFYLEKEGYRPIALEVKWAKNTRINVNMDIEKLRTLSNQNPLIETFLLAFGKQSIIENLRFSNGVVLTRRGNIVKWDAGRTKYAAASYVVT